MSEGNTANPAVAEAIDSLGGDTPVAKKLNLTSWAVSKWREKLPLDRVLWLSKQTGWEYTPHKLCPQMYPNPTDALPPKYKKAALASAKRRATDLQPTS